MNDASAHADLASDNDTFSSKLVSLDSLNFQKNPLATVAPEGFPTTAELMSILDTFVYVEPDRRRNSVKKNPTLLGHAQHRP
jgi:hypothetical protein